MKILNILNVISIQLLKIIQLLNNSLSLVVYYKGLKWIFKYRFSDVDYSIVNMQLIKQSKLKLLSQSLNFDKAIYIFVKVLKVYLFCLLKIKNLNLLFRYFIALLNLVQLNSTLYYMHLNSQYSIAFCVYIRKLKRLVYFII